MEKLTGKFNTILLGKVLVNIDEPRCQSKQEFFAMNETLKSIITNETLLVEPKGKDPFSVRDNTNIVGTTNNPHAFVATQGDRRLAIFEASREFAKDRSYHAKLREATDNQEFGNALFTWALDYVKSDEFIDVTDQTNIPSTAIRERVLESSRPPLTLFVEQFQGDESNFVSDEIGKTDIVSPLVIPKIGLYEKYQEWCKKTGNVSVKYQYFCSQMQEFNFVENKHVVGGNRVRCYHIDIDLK